MGIWEFIGSTAESVKRNVPDATPLTTACKTSYSYGAAAVSKIDQAVRTNGLGQWMPDDETKSKIGLYTTKFAKNASLYALQEGYKLIPGGVAFSKIVSKTLNDVKHENLIIEKRKKLSDGAEMQTKPTPADGHYVDQSPEDVIRIFMMKEFFGARFFNDLMVTKGKKKKKPE